MLFIFAGFFSNKIHGQDTIAKSKFTYSIAAEHGKILPTNFYISALETSKQYTGYNFAVRYQTDGSEDWHVYMEIQVTAWVFLW